MTTRQKLDLSINAPTEITLLYSEPITGKSQYGEYFMYAVAVGEEEYSFFATQEVHDQLKELKKGSRAIVTKLAAQRGSKLVTSYDVKLIGATLTVPVLGTTSEQPDVSTPFNAHNNDDGLYEIMLRSYKEAIKITTELGCSGESSRIAISLFIARSKQSNY